MTASDHHIPVSRATSIVASSRSAAPSPTSTDERPVRKRVDVAVPSPGGMATQSRT